MSKGIQPDILERTLKNMDKRWVLESHRLPLALEQVDPEHRVMVIPDSYRDDAWLARFSALTAAKIRWREWTTAEAAKPDTARKFTFTTMQVVEELRLRRAMVTALSRTGFSDEEIWWRFQQPTMEIARASQGFVYYEPGRWRDMARLVVLSAFNREPFKTVVESLVAQIARDKGLMKTPLPDKLGPVIDFLYEMLQNGSDLTEEGARWIAERIDLDIEQEDQQEPGGCMHRGRDGREREEELDSGEVEEMSDEEWQKLVAQRGSDKDDKAHQFKIGRTLMKDSTAPPGTATMTYPPLVEEHDIRRKVYRRVATDSGTGVGDIARMITDQKVFRESRPGIFGTVLIDVSGSMALQMRDILECMRQVPGATVGVYAGAGDSGVVAVVARAGKRATTQDIAAVKSLGGNIVDVPALEWLGTQPRPRVWVSDGAATGIGDELSSRCQALAELLMHRHHIIRVNRVHDAWKVVRGVQDR